MFVRLDRLRRPEDIITRPPEFVNQRAEPPETPNSSSDASNDTLAWSDAAKLVELLQVLLFIRRTGFVRRIAHPPLCILLSCWDELPDVPRNPIEELRRRLPLLAQFVDSVWDRECLEVFGLSAQGRSLSRDLVDEEYLDQGPEQFGYVILPDGKRVNDLTEPVASLLGQTKITEPWERRHQRGATHLRHLS